MSLDGIKEQAYDAPGVYFKDADTWSKRDFHGVTSAVETEMGLLEN